MMSWYLPEKRALMLHVPRTGGTWVKEAMHLTGIPLLKWGTIGPQYRPRKHTILGHMHPELLTKIDYIFSFVRHPVDYYVSVWRFTTRSVDIWPEKMRLVFEQNNPAAISEGVLCWKPDFDEWLDEMLEEEPGWVTRWFERFVGPPRGEFCHFIGRTKTIEQDAKEVMNILGYGKNWNEARKQIELIHHAKNRIRETKAPHFKPTEEQRKRIERSERVTISRFFGEDTINKRIYRNQKGEPVQ